MVSFRQVPLARQNYAFLHGMFEHKALQFVTPKFISYDTRLTSSTCWCVTGPPIFLVQHWKAGSGLWTRLPSEYSLYWCHTYYTYNVHVHLCAGMWAYSLRSSVNSEASLVARCFLAWLLLMGILRMWARWSAVKWPRSRKRRAPWTAFPVIFLA